MKRNNTFKIKERWISAGLALVLLASVLFPALAFADEPDAIHIQSQEDLRELAENCRLDTWSQGKTVILDQDITLDRKAEDFLPIPTFGGTFEGNGHTISGFSLTGEDSHAGLFDTLQESAAVNHLKVVGQVTPSGAGNIIGGIAGTNYGKIMNCSFEGAVKGDDSVGGLVGINETTGQLISCSFQGTVTGEHYVGGVAGQNTGSLIQCRNEGEINTTAVEVSADLSDLSLLGTTESVPAGTDIGGIAGFSVGVIQSCTNAGNVGYEHMGYNVGGIAGRQSGYLDGCTNIGTIKGRKDVGGIAGQLEPQVTLRYNEDLLDKLWAELDTLQGLTNQATTHAQNSSSTLAGNFNDLSANISAAKNAVSGLSGALTDWGNKNLGQINDISARLSWMISQLGPVSANITDSVSALQEAVALLQQAAGKADTGSEEGAAAAAELEQAAQDLQTAADHAQAAASHLSAALELAQKMVDGDQSAETITGLLNELNAAGAEAQQAKSSLESALAHAETARGYLESMGEAGTAALEDLNAAFGKLESALGSLGGAVDQISQIVSTLADQPAISFTPVDSSVTSQGDALDSALSQVITNANNLSGNLTSASDTLLGDMRAINNQLGVIVNLVRDEMEEAKEKDAADPFEDVSDQASAEPAAGKVMNSLNSGSVQGDVNVAGMVGSMSVEYDFDPEDDLTEDGTRSLNFQYRTLAVVTGCTNEGSISSKKDYAGGIVGRMDLGAVKSCESYGQVESSGGDYVGGIAGVCRATIRNCYAKCSPSGSDYIGGVAGSSEENSVITGCYTLVEIPRGSRYTGAICGTETGEFTDNYYVSDSLAGLGRISYTGKAEPLSFEALTQAAGLPDRMTRFTLRFLVEGEELKSYDFSYGASFGPEAFPEIQEKEGYYAAWDTQDLSDLRFDKTVTAEYVRYVLTLPSQASRPSGRAVFLVDGNFDDQSSLTAVAVDDPEQIKGETAAEQWHLSWPDSSGESYTVHYLTPDETTRGYSVFVRENDIWEQVPCSDFGSYLVFPVTSCDLDVALVPAASIWLQCLLVGAAVVPLILVILAAVRKSRRTRVKDLPAPASAPEAVNPENAPKKLTGAKKKSLIVLICLVLLGVVFLCVFLNGTFGSAAKACTLLEEFARQPESAMDLSMSIQLNDTLTNAELDITRTQVEGRPVTCIQSQGLALYYADNAVIMENGKAYKISDLHPDYSLLPSKAVQLFKTGSFSTSRSGGVVTCQLIAEGENAKELLKVLLPGQEENFSDTQKLTVKLSVSGDQILSLDFTSQGTLVDDSKTAYSLTAQLKPKQSDGTLTIPDPVKETVLSGNTAGEISISQDLFRLLSAWTILGQEESFSADVALNVQCGPISLDETLKYGQALVDGAKISCVRKDDLALYFSGGIFCDQNGQLLTEQDTSLASRARLLELLKQICLKGEFDCTDTGNNTWLYTLALDENAMKSIAYAAAPEMESLPVTLSSGSVQVMVSGTTIKEVNCSCTGGLEGLEEVAPVTVSAKLMFEQSGELTVPGAVKDQLIQRGGANHGE